MLVLQTDKGVLKMGKASTKAKNKYNATNYERISYIVPKGRKEELKKAAESQGYTSLNSFITDAVNALVKTPDADPNHKVYVADGIKVECWQEWEKGEKATFFCWFDGKFENVERVVRFDKKEDDMYVDIKGIRYYMKTFI